MSYEPSGSAAIIIAAGASTRLGEPKALARLDEEPIVARLARLAFDCGIAHTVVVVGPDDDVADAVRAMVAPLGTEVVVNEARDTGRTSSIQCGVRALAASMADGRIASAFDGLLMMPADIPCVLADDLAALIDGASSREGVSVLQYQGRGGHPVWIGYYLVPHVLALGPDESLRLVINGDPDRGWPAPPIALLDTQHNGPILSVKTPHDLQRARSWLAANPE